MSFKVLVIIVSFNGEDWMEQCLNSLKYSDIPLQILVVDNASTDRTAEIIINKFPKVEFLQNKENIGFGRANNQGFQIALERKVDYLFLLNQDAWIQEHSISKLIQAHQNQANFSIISPIHLNGDGIGLESAFEYFLNQDCTAENKQLILNKDHSEIVETNFVNAAAWLLPLSTLEIIGGFDPLFFYTGEDTDYINRLKFHQLKVGIYAQAKIHHDTSGRLPFEYQPNAPLFEISRKADFLKVLKNINQSYWRCLVKAYLLLLKDLFKSISKPKEAVIYLNLLLNSWTWLQAVSKSRVQANRKGKTYLNTKNH